MLDNWVTWLILHLMVKNSASVEVMFIVWWIILMTELSWMWIYAIDVVTWFFILVSNTITAVLGSDDVWNIILLSLQIYVFMLSSFLLFIEWKKKQLEKMSISLSLGENSLLNKLKEGKTLFNLLFTSTIGPLSSNHCLFFQTLVVTW